MTWRMRSMNLSSTGLRSWEMIGSLCKHTAPCRTQGDGGLALCTFWALDEIYRTAAFNRPGPELICHSDRQAYLQQGAAIVENTHNATVSERLGQNGLTIMDMVGEVIHTM